MSGAFKFIYDPNYDHDNDIALYNYVEICGGTKDDNINTVFNRFVQFLEGCGYSVDKEKVGYGEY